MSDAPLCACGQPSPGAVLCRSCTAQLGRRLAYVAAIAGDLEDAVARQLVRGTGGGKRHGDEVPMPLDADAMAVRDELANCLSTWVRVMRDVHRAAWRWPDDTIADMARWLAARPESMRQLAAAEELATEVQHHAGRAAAVIDQRPERIGAGRCELCGGQLWMSSDDAAVCGRCGEAFVGIVQRRLEAAAKADVLGTPPEIAGALGRLGITVSAGTIRMWASRSRLTVRPGGVYSMADVMDLCAKRGALLARTVRVAHTVRSVGAMALGNPRGHSHTQAIADGGMPMARRKSPGPIHSKAQQGFLFATHKTFAKRWAHGAGETGPRGNPASKAAFARLPRRKGVRKRV